MLGNGLNIWITETVGTQLDRNENYLLDEDNLDYSMLFQSGYGQTIFFSGEWLCRRGFIPLNL